MNMTFKYFLEHESAEHGRNEALEQSEVLRRLQNSTLLQASVRSPEADKSLALFKYEDDARNCTIILTPRLEQNNPIGFVVLQKNDKFWKVLDLWLEHGFRGHGIITNLYRVLSAVGYKLQSGKVLSKKAEQVWLRLGELGLAKVFDSESGKIEEFSKKPIGDGNLMIGLEPRYFWITEGQLQNTVFHRGNLEQMNEGLSDFLNGIRSRKTIGMGTLEVQAEV